MICELCGDFVPLLNMGGHLADEHPEKPPEPEFEWAIRNTITGHVFDAFGFMLDKDDVEEIIKASGRNDLEVVKRPIAKWEKA
jgi:hypothetical protein